MVTPAVCREAAAHLRSLFAMSERRACRVAGADRSSVRYRRRRSDDGELRQRLKELAVQRRRFGYRRLWVLLRREGHAVNKKRVYRLYRQERLMVRRRGGRKRAVGTRSPMPVPSGPNRRWSLDFVHDQCQTACNRDPGSAWKRDPSSALVQACPGSEQEGPARVAQCPHERRSGARGRLPVCPPGQAGAVQRFKRGA
jgi:transposase InsO family protein